MALIVKTIGSGGGRDYSTLAGWAASLPANLVTDGNSYEGDCYNDSEFVSATNLLTLNGNTADATHTITLTTGPGQSFRDNVNAQTNALRYNQSNGVAIRCTGNDDAILIGTFEDYVSISNLQISNQVPVSVPLNDAAANGLTVVSNCILTGGSGVYCLRAYGTARNCLMYTTIGGGRGIRFNDVAAAAYFCTVANASDATVGEFAFGNTGTVKNCAAFGFSALEAGGSSTYTTCMTDLASPPSGVTGSIAFANQFQNTTVAAGDWREKAGASLQGAGTADATNGATDIVGTARPQGAGLWDVGCWQLPVAGGGILMGARVM